MQPTQTRNVETRGASVGPEGANRQIDYVRKEGKMPLEQVKKENTQRPRESSETSDTLSPVGHGDIAVGTRMDAATAAAADSCAEISSGR